MHWLNAVGEVTTRQYLGSRSQQMGRQTLIGNSAIQDWNTTGTMAIALLAQ